MRFPCRSISALIVALAALTCFVTAARAQEFPSRVIRLVVTFPAGGPTDFVDLWFVSTSGSKRGCAPS